MALILEQVVTLPQSVVGQHGVTMSSPSHKFEIQVITLEIRIMLMVRLLFCDFNVVDI